MFFKKTFLFLIALINVISLTGCGAKHITKNTLEPYFLFEESMNNAKVSHQEYISYLANIEEHYVSVDQIKNRVTPVKSVNAFTCDFKGKTCEEYSYDGSIENKAGINNYTYVYNRDGMRISKSSNDVFTEYLYKDGRIAEINEYSGNRKTADSQLLSKTIFSYNDEGVGNLARTTQYNGNDTVVIDYVVQYNDDGLPAVINTIIDDELTTYTLLTYTSKGLIETRTMYTITPNLDVINGYFEYTYE